jgi:hypothetical protein
MGDENNSEGMEGGVMNVRRDNPKYVQAQKDGKPRMEYLVGTVLPGDAACHAHGADKYGERNWRIDPINASTYEAAILRHFMAYFYEQEDLDKDSGLSHLYHIRACCAVMLDAEQHGTLIDDRKREVSNGRKDNRDVTAIHKDRTPSVSITFHNADDDTGGRATYSDGVCEFGEFPEGFVRGECDPDAAGGLR